MREAWSAQAEGWSASAGPAAAGVRTELRERRADIFVGQIRSVIHHVRDIGGSYVIVLIRIHVSPENWRESMYETPARSGAL